MSEVVTLDQGSSEAAAATLRLPLGLRHQTDEALQQAYVSYVDQLAAVAERFEQARQRLGHYDAAAIKQAVSLCFWGRSGSWLLQSYLDGHEHLLILPRNASHQLYAFLLEFPALSVWDKLIAYPLYTELREGPEGALFAGESPIGAADYYAAVHALYSLYQDRPDAWLNSRRRFIQFLHVAYGVATGLRPAISTPLIIYCQHWPKEEYARCFIGDFPDGRFIHTIRDPISTIDSWYERQIELQTFILEQRPHLIGHYLGRISSHYLDPSGQTIRSLLRADRAHPGLEAVTRAVRFEDLHLTPEATMRRVADWLGIPYRPCLVESTFNGTPYLHRSGNTTWIGANPRNAQRRSRNLSAADRWLLFALLHENFMSWNYASPKILDRRWVRFGVIATLLPLPMKMEFLNIKLIFQRQLLPGIKRRRILYVCGAPLYVLLRRLVMMVFIASQARLRWRHDVQSLQPL
jgi:hypothetical protein